jgi:hypothetical protein
MSKWGSNKVGAYADSARGVYMGERIQQIATDEGWDGEFADADDEYYSDATDEAEDWLNDNIADDGHFFGTSEQGDWGYWTVEDD